MLQTKYAHLGAADTQSTDYTFLRYLFGQVSIHPSDALVDVGSGKGRVINWWLHLGLKNPLFGIELDPDLAAALRHRLRAYTNVTILTGNVIDLLPASGSIFYLYNPFDQDVLHEFKKQLETRCQHNVTVIYYNCIHLGVFANDPAWAVAPVPPPARPEVKFFEAAICVWRPGH